MKKVNVGQSFTFGTAEKRNWIWSSESVQSAEEKTKKMICVTVEKVLWQEKSSYWLILFCFQRYSDKKTFFFHLTVFDEVT